ncbi:hypothetical protein D3C85_1553540 [compost metagenome]
MSGKNDIFVSGKLRIVHIGRDILLGLCEVLIKGANALSLAGNSIYNLVLPKSVPGRGVDEVDAGRAQGMPDIVIKRIGVKVTMDTSNGNDHSVCGTRWK